MSSGGNRQWISHLDAAQLENARFLLESGLDKDRVAKRLGLTRDGLDKMLERAKK